MKNIYILLALLLTQNLYSQWSIQLDSISIPHENNSVYFTSEETGYISAWDGRLYKTTNSGTNWTYDVVAPGQIVTSVFFLDQNTGYLTATNGRWLKTTDAGNSFSTFINAGYGGSLAHIFFINSETGWCVGGNGSGSNFVSRTIDGGANWTVQKTFSEQESPASILFLNADTGFTSCGNNIYRTNNGGINWNVKYNAGNYITHIFFRNNTGYAVGTNSTILKSTDHGDTWAPLVSPVPSRTLWQSYFTDENTGWIAGSSGLILMTTNGGINFIQQPSGTAKDLVSIYFVNSRGWCVGSSGETPMSGIILNLNPTNINVNIKLLFEGMYYPLFSQMSRKDSLTAYLREVSAPYEIVDSARNIIDSISFTAKFTFENAASGNYYIVARHLNSIETWSRVGGEALINNGSIYNYDFTNSQSKAFGNNLVLVNPKWCVYSGDVDQNGSINLDDLLSVYNDAINFVPGYTPTDLNGDNIVNLSDLLIVYNNVSKFVEMVRP